MTLKSLPDVKILDWTKFKAFADNKLNVTNSFLTDDDTRSFSGECRSRSDCTNSAV